MKERERTYTMEELEAESGFDRRTVSYYVQEEILPRVGRRGPRTRYPRPFLDRLLFVRRVRDLQDKGELPPLTLAEIKEILDRVPPETVAAVASGEEKVARLVLGSEGSGSMDALSSPVFHSSRANSLEQGVSHAARLHSIRWMGDEETGPEPPAIETTVAELLDQAELSREEDPSREGRWTTVGVTEDVLLTVRGDRPSVLRLAETLARWLRERRGG